MGSPPIGRRRPWPGLTVLGLLLASCAGGPSGGRPSTAPDASGRLPAAAFFRDPALSHLALSPDGRRIAAVRSQTGVHLLVVIDTHVGEIRPLAKHDEPGESISRVGWGGDERILVSIEKPSPLATGMRARMNRLLAVGLDGSKPKYLGRKWPGQQWSWSQDNIIDWLPEDRDHVLLNWFAPGQWASVRRLNVHSGSLQLVVGFKPFVHRWYSDHEGRVRAGSGWRGTQYRLYARSDDGAFEKIFDYDPFEESGFGFAGFSPDPATIFVYAESETGRYALFEYDLASGALGSLVAEHPDYDVSGPLFSQRDGRLLCVRFEADRPQRHCPDEDARRLFEEIDLEFPGRASWVVASDAAERIVLIAVYGDTQPPVYYLVDRDAGRMQHLFEAYPEIEPSALSPMKPVTYRARDGREIHAYLTLPRNREPGMLATIVLPHGGPAARDVWGYHPEVQFLASRGFAVFQPNFRGSTGYGREHSRAGHRKWGLSMQDDISDGVGWLVEQGIADPERVGIYGASYGGYAALMGAAKTPDLFAAAASFAGVTDLITLLDDDWWYGWDEFNKPTVGDSAEDRTRLRETSPARLADRIRIPILIAHGTEDPRVHVKQAHAMADAIEDAGGDVELHIYPREVHGFIDERNRIDFYEKLGAFFERHLAPER